jgi:hypothetical protein
MVWYGMIGMFGCWWMRETWPGEAAEDLEGASRSGPNHVPGSRIYSVEAPEGAEPPQVVDWGCQSRTPATGIFKVQWLGPAWLNHSCASVYQIALLRE